jgi:hypothetical protein
LIKINKEKLKKIKRSAPIFIIGCPRSGTTFCFKALSEVLDVGFGRDNTLFMKLYKNISKYGDLSEDRNVRKLLSKVYSSYDYQKRFKQLDIINDEFISCIEERKYSNIVRTIYAYMALTQGKSRWGGKTPDYTGSIESLIDFFPDIKIIHLVRDGRDVALSLYNRLWGPKDAYVAATYWKKSVDLASIGKRFTNKRFIEIRYEDLLKTPDTVFKQLLNFFDFSELDYRKKCLEFEKKIIPKIKKNNAYKWKSKMRQRDVRIFELAAGQQLKRYGYEIVNKEHTKCDLSTVRRGYHHGRNLFIKGIKGHLFPNIYRRLLRMRRY